MKKIDSAEEWERLKKRWEDAPRGDDGIKRIRWVDFVATRAWKLDEVMTEPMIITADGVEKCIVMTYDYYLSIWPVNPNPKRQPMMKRFEGVLFREVV